MRRLWLAIGIAAMLGGLAAGGWFYFHPLPLGPQVAAYQIGTEPTFSLAKREIASLDNEPDRQTKLRELVGGWGTGNAQFDLYLAQYLGEPECSDAMRETFSLELGWRPELLSRWAHYWAWRSRQEPAAEIASIAEYLAALVSLEPPRRLTWREVLNLQASFALTNHSELGRRLTPDNWPGRFREWIAANPDWRELKRPKSPLPDWQGPSPR
jgi:hypothetical protein